MAETPPETPDSPDVRTIRQLVRLMHRFDLTAIDLLNEQTKIRLRRGSGQVRFAPTPSAPAPAPAPLPAAASPAPSAPPPAVATDGLFIRSPMVGTFYSAPSPDAPPFVSVGTVVRPETIVCVIEAMKVFTDINAGLAGKVVEALVKSGQPVEFDQPLFRLEPA